jgi:hypothetical protein
MIETFSAASSGVASTLFIGMLCLCCLTLLWVFAEQSPPAEPGEGESDRPGQWPAQAGCAARQALHRVMRYLSMAIAVISLALIFGAAVAFLGGKLLEAAR